ncbi:MAG: hypothetical protein WAK37_22690 [Pseudolabrys sp.]
MLFAPVIHPQMHEWIGGNGASVESAGNGSSLLPSSRAIAGFKYRRGDDETAGTVCCLGIYPQLKNFTLRRTESGGVCMRLILKVRI